MYPVVLVQSYSTPAPKWFDLQADRVDMELGDGHLDQVCCYFPSDSMDRLVE